MADTKFDRFVRTLPPVFKPRINPIIGALLKSWGIAHDDLVAQIENTKEQLFVKTAQGTYLDRLGSGLGVSRPQSLGLLDSDFQKLIPVLSLEAKNIRKVFYEVMDVFWGPLFSRTNVTSQNYAPFNLVTGDTLTVSVDGGTPQTAKILSGDLATQGAASAVEIANVLSRISGVTVSIITEPGTSQEYINIRTNTPGARGSIEIETSTMTSGTKLNFALKKTRITDLSQRTVVWEITPKELLIELPAIIPTLRRTLKGSHHFHADSTLASPVPPGNGIWEGSFLYSPLGVPYTVTRQKAVIEEALFEGNVYTKVTVDDSSNIPNSPGTLIFGWGLSDEEEPVKYINVPNKNTVLLDPGHVFQKTHLPGTPINVLVPSLAPYVPQINGNDLAIYLTSPANSRSVVQNLLSQLAAAGVLVKFAILLPNYEYLIVNPYLENT
jgi:hypothetical protein